MSVVEIIHEGVWERQRERQGEREKVRIHYVEGLGGERLLTPSSLLVLGVVTTRQLAKGSERGEVLSLVSRSAPRAIFAHRPVLGTKLLICRRPPGGHGGSARESLQLAAGSPGVSGSLVLPSPKQPAPPPPLASLLEGTGGLDSSCCSPAAQVGHLLCPLQAVCPWPAI